MAASVSIARWVIAPGLAAFRAAHPGTRIRLIGTIWPDDFKSALADVEIRFGSEKQVGQNAHRLGPDMLVPVTAPEFTDDWHNHPLIEPVGISESWQDWATLAGIADLPRPEIHVDSHGAGLDLAVHGAGTALTSSLLAQDALRTGRVVLADPRSLPSTEGYFLAVNSRSAEATAFAKWLQEALDSPR